MKKIIILDYSNAKVYVCNYDSNIYEDFSDFLVDFNNDYDLNCKEGDCNWMIVDEISLNIL